VNNSHLTSSSYDVAADGEDGPDEYEKYSKIVGGLEILITGGIWTRGLASVRINHDIILIIHDFIVVVPTEHKDMRVEVVVRIGSCLVILIFLYCLRVVY